MASEKQRRLAIETCHQLNRKKVTKRTDLPTRLAIWELDFINMTIIDGLGNKSKAEKGQLQASNTAKNQILV